ncbi:hypothetical protein [uncultured Roseovarius sp.]|uniref:hypothetical protein n=1 Tax=uncultured Roseovarius sp. TaxID=293344 RepID=UPI00261F2F60|nr:hypothetical protein [uncultured Roseovarius sp.]
MTLQNRVLPDGQITALPFRGTLMGNRGILHDDRQRLKTSRWTHPHWVTCVLEFKDWHRPVMIPNHYTELFFLDECVALAAGHRPCGLCRREDYTRFRSAWAMSHGKNTLDQDDRVLHAARVTRTRQHIRHAAPIETLPDGCFIWHDDAPHLIWHNHLLRYDGGIYTASLPNPGTGDVTVLTPAPTVSVLGHGYVPQPHSSALSLLNQA